LCARKCSQQAESFIVKYTGGHEIILGRLFALRFAGFASVMANSYAAHGASRYSEWMRVKVLYFGVLRDVFGAADETTELDDDATVADLLRNLRGRTSNNAMAEPNVDERLWRSIAVAVNREYASTSIVLREGDEVALLPPVSGGTSHSARSALLAVEVLGTVGKSAC
jgi:molybdopterin converting factor subunit 1